MCKDLPVVGIDFFFFSLKIPYLTSSFSGLLPPGAGKSFRLLYLIRRFLWTAGASPQRCWIHTKKTSWWCASWWDLSLHLLEPSSSSSSSPHLLLLLHLLRLSHCRSHNCIIIISSYVVIYIYDIKSEHLSIKQSDSIITIILSYYCILMFKSSSYLIITSSHTHQPHHHIIVSLLCLHWYLHTTVFGCCSCKYSNWNSSGDLVLFYSFESSCSLQESKPVLIDVYVDTTQ